MYKTFKIRLFPNDEQTQFIEKQNGACRFIWNYFLSYREKYYDNYGIHLNEYYLSKYLTFLMKTEEYGWLKEYSSYSLRAILNRQEKSYNQYFNRTGRKPKFKRKRDNDISIPIRADRLSIYEDALKLEKIGLIRYRFHYKNIDVKSMNIKSANLVLTNNKYILFVSAECENQAPIKGSKIVGIDLGIKELAVCSVDYEKIIYHNINKSNRIKTLESKERHLQRVISRKFLTNNSYNRTKNIKKYIKKLNKVRSKLKNIRKDYIHKVTSEIISFGLLRVTVEDLDISNLLKNRKLSKSIKDNYLYLFRCCIEYKCAWNGVEFVVANKYFPSSKICSCCGNKKTSLSLSDRVYRCEYCGNIIDRDFNAAINLMNYVNS